MNIGIVAACVACARLAAVSGSVFSEPTPPKPATGATAASGAMVPVPPLTEKQRTQMEFEARSRLIRETTNLASQTDPDNRASLEALLLRVAGEYLKYPRVSDHADWAPFLCSAPPAASASMSGTMLGTPHGQKLYFLYAAHQQDYREMSESDGLDASLNGYDRDPSFPKWKGNPIGQIVVKEAFIALEADPLQDVGLIEALRQEQRTYPNVEPPLRGYRQWNGKPYKTGPAAGLFVMVKLDPKYKEQTDAGWIYATISPDNKVTSIAGASGKCYGCHVQTTRDRLYGYKWSWPLDKDKQPVPPERKREIPPEAPEQPDPPKPSK